MASLLIADDHPIFRKGLVSLIKDSFPNMDIMEASDGKEAIDFLESKLFSVAILDIDMPEKSGLDVLDFIRLNEIETSAVILTMHNDELFFNEAFDRGALGFVLKEDSSLEIIDCIQSMLMKHSFVSKKLMPFLHNRHTFSAQLGAIKQALATLTPAELSTLKLVSENRSSKEIAELIFVTEKSVENYRSRICKKLNISGGSNTLYKWCITHKDLIK